MKEGAHEGAPGSASDNPTIKEPHSTSSTVPQINPQDWPSIIEVPVDSFVSRQIRPEEPPWVRELWWRSWRCGHRLPVERGVILIDGGRT